MIIFRLCNLLIFSPIRLMVYNRWGEIVFEGIDGYWAWDGRYKEQELEMGLYVFVYEYHEIGSEDVLTMKGNVTLVR